MGVLGASIDDKVMVLACMAATVVVSAGLIAFACQTKYDFTGAGPYLLAAVLVLFIFSIVLVFVAESDITRMAFGALGTLIFSMFLVYDVQLIVGGKHKKYQYEVDEYVFAAMSVYLDIVYMLYYMLILTDAAS